MPAFLYIKIPWESEKPLETLRFDEGEIGEKNGGDILYKHLSNSCDPKQHVVEATPLKRMSPVNVVAENLINAPDLAGIYAYHLSSIAKVSSDKEKTKQANLRATCLSMACGLHSSRFYGEIYISRLGYFPVTDHMQLMNLSVACEEIEYACLTPDLRLDIISKVKEQTTGKTVKTDEIRLPWWLTEASKSNYEDAAALSVLAKVMKSDKDSAVKEAMLEKEKFENGDKSDVITARTRVQIPTVDELKSEQKEDSILTGGKFISRSPLCLHCRGPTNTLCKNCNGAYFCQLPRICRVLGWSHRCSCKTWKVYTDRREDLSSFPFNWHAQLVSRDCQISDKPYREYLTSKLGVLGDNKEVNWWNTEGDGWSGGGSESAKQIDIMKRLSFVDGFALDRTLIPPESDVTDDDCVRGNVKRESENNMLQLNSWEDYYKLRGIPMESPIALLMTFPLTIYYAIQKYGAVPATVAKMLQRPMRVHVVGVEKELNFLDMFKEISFLLPDDMKLEIVFIVREDMLPQSCMDFVESKNKIDLPNFSLSLQSGSYNDSIDPKFDVGTGPPDMVIGMNAGLFAYESWRSVVEFLAFHHHVVGCFTDYNEHSGLNCACLGGGVARESLSVNPFRQPHAMPVYSMNLPQFSNGFMYVFNEQHLDT